jgi:MFS family permease
LIVLDRRQKVILIWAGIALILTNFQGNVLILALPAITREFHASTLALSQLGSVLIIGSLGALPLATLADRFGRRRMIAVGVAGSSLANLASGFAASLAMLAFLRLFAYAFEVLVIGVVTALIVEEAPVEHRGLAVSVITLLSAAGIFIVTVAYPIVTPHWRWLYFAGGAGVLVSPFLWWLLPESKAWQHVQVARSALRLLFTSPWRRRIIVFAVETGLLAVLLEPAGLLYTVFATFDLHWSPAAVSILIIVSGVVGGASFIAGGYMTDRFGRRGPAIALTIATAASTSLSFATGSIGFFAGNVLWSAFASAQTPVFGSWSAELFPTRARATAEATISVVAAAGGIAGLQAVGRLAPSAGLGGAIELGGVVAIAGALLLFLLPETKQQPLPE